MSPSVSIVPEIRRGAAVPAREASLGAALTTLFRSGLRAWRMRRDLRLVSSLDDRALADIGIGRGQAESAVLFGRAELFGRADRFGRAELAEDRSWRPALDSQAGPVGGTEWR